MDEQYTLPKSNVSNISDVIISMLTASSAGINCIFARKLKLSGRNSLKSRK